MKINILNVVLLRKRCYNKAIINKRDDTHMEPVRLLEALAVAEKLKDATRHCYTSGGRRESVAEHSWRITLMAYFVSDEFPEADEDFPVRTSPETELTSAGKLSANAAWMVYIFCRASAIPVLLCLYFLWFHHMVLSVNLK